MTKPKKRSLGGLLTVDGVTLEWHVKSEPAWGTSDGDIGLRLSVMKCRRDPDAPWRAQGLARTDPAVSLRTEAAPPFALSRKAQGHARNADRRRALGHRGRLESARARPPLRIDPGRKRSAGLIFAPSDAIGGFPPFSCLTLGKQLPAKRQAFVNQQAYGRLRSKRKAQCR